MLELARGNTLWQHRNSGFSYRIFKKKKNHTITKFRLEPQSKAIRTVLRILKCIITDPFVLYINKIIYVKINFQLKYW